MKPATILHILPTLDQSGAEKQLSLLAMHLPRDRFTSHVCAVTRGGYYEHVLRDAGVPVTVLAKRTKWDPFVLWRLRGLIGEIQPDIVHTWMFTGNAYGRVAARMAGAERIVASERCIDEWKSGYHFAIDRFLSRWTDRIVVNSAGIGRFYARQGIPADRIRMVPNGIDLASRPVGIDRRVMRGVLGVPVDVPLVAFVGRLWPQKRVQDLIWAADILRLSGWDFHVLIVGDGPRRASLERFSESLEITPMVHFLGHRDDAREILEAVDVVVLPSQYEGMPNAILEGMLSQKPVVATRIAGVDEVVEDGTTGILVPPRTPLELARGIRTILADPELGRRMGEAGYQRVVREFSLEKMIRGYERLYEDVLGLRASGENAESAPVVAGPVDP